MAPPHFFSQQLSNNFCLKFSLSKLITCFSWLLRKTIFSKTSCECKKYSNIFSAKILNVQRPPSPPHRQQLGRPQKILLDYHWIRLIIFPPNLINQRAWNTKGLIRSSNLYLSPPEENQFFALPPPLPTSHRCETPIKFRANQKLEKTMWLVGGYNMSALEKGTRRSRLLAVQVSGVTLRLPPPPPLLPTRRKFCRITQSSLFKIL